METVVLYYPLHTKKIISKEKWKNFLKNNLKKFLTIFESVI